MKIGIISDTHNVLRKEVMNELKTCNYIFHAGDFVNKDIYDQLRGINKIFAVKGNNDHFDLDEELYVTIGGFQFYMTHQKKEIKNVDFYIYGHSHHYNDEIIDGVHYLNPGSCGRRRFSLPLTYMILYIFDNKYYIERKDIQI